MQICSNCKSKQFDGTIFCGDCGASLVAPPQHETTLALGPRASTGDRPTVGGAAVPAAGPQISLVIINSGRRISLDIGEDLLIGRKDHARGIFPDVDLGLDGGYDSGVSRRHAILAWRQGCYTLEDLGSSNGTFINGRRMAPAQVVQLRNGDEFKCGTLLIRVELG